MIRIAICDDERYMSDHIKELVLDFFHKKNREAAIRLKLNDHFFRCHRSYLINLKHLKGYQKGNAYMDNGREIPVSRLRSREFSSVVLQYMKNL